MIVLVQRLKPAAAGAQLELFGEYAGEWVTYTYEVEHV